MRYATPFVLGFALALAAFAAVPAFRDAAPATGAFTVDTNEDGVPDIIYTIRDLDRDHIIVI